jgi:hypothetical protein
MDVDVQILWKPFIVLFLSQKNNHAPTRHNVGGKQNRNILNNMKTVVRGSRSSGLLRRVVW